MIISASRRCDIPSHFGEWFLNRLKDGYVLVQNPYNKDRLSRVELNLKTVDLIVFWTKNPLPFLKYLPEIDKLFYPYYFEFTLTPYGNEIERNLPDKNELINAFISLSKMLSKNRMVWRYDPIIIDEKYNLNYHKEKFSYMASRLSGYTNRCVISFVDPYKNVTVRMGKNPAEQMNILNINKISEIFSKIAKENGIEIFTCAENYDLKKYGIKQGACIDRKIVESILDCKIDVREDKNQRPECRCIESIDIGTYNCCGNGCTYCYALQSEKSALLNIKKHDPKSPVLIGQAGPNAIVTDRACKSIIVNQLSLFK